MMKKFLFITGFLFLSLSIILINGCKKDSTTNNSSITNRTPLLTGASWRMIAYTISPAISGTTDIFATMQACETDNYYKFLVNGTYTYDEGPTLCNSGDPQINDQGYWQFNTGQTIINFDNGDVWTILQLTTTTLKVSYPMVISGTNYTLTMTFIAQ
jgi:hypothetical protein